MSSGSRANRISVTLDLDLDDMDDEDVGQVANNLRSIVESAMAEGLVTHGSGSCIDQWSCAVTHNDSVVLEYRESLKPGGLYE